MKGNRCLNKYNKAVLLLIMTAALFFAASGRFSQVTKFDRSIVIGADNHLPPYSYVNDNGIFKGFYLDIARAIAVEAGIDVELYPMPWYEVEEELADNRIDAVLGMNVNTTSPSFILSYPVLQSSEGIFVRRDNKYIVNLEDLRHVKVAIHRGNVTMDILNQLDPDNIEYVDNQQQGIQMLMAGKIDAFIGDRLSGLYTIQKWKQENFIKVVGDPINVRGYGIAVKKEDEELIKLFNKGLEAIKVNGTYDKIYKKWFGETVSTGLRLTRQILAVLVMVLVSIAVIFFLILRWNSALKKEVEKRTSELDMANKQLLFQKERLENDDRFKEEILNSVLYGMVTLDRNGTITFINYQGLDIFGIEREEIIGANINDTMLSHFFDKDKIANVLDKGKHYRNYEIDIVLDNVIKTFNYNFYPLRGKGNSITGAILNFRDISEEKRLKAELARKDKMRALGLMVAGFAHEIRNPLTSIKTFTDLIPQKINNENFRNKFVEIVPSEINRLNSLITDLLEYSKPKRSNRQMINVKQIFDSVFVLFSKQIKDRGIDFEVKIDRDAMIYADKHQMKQVFINLMLNSLEAVRDGGRIKLYANRLNNLTEVVIEDNGRGISKENLDRVMDPFFTTKKDGSGLGLFICYQIVRENRGRMSIDSQPGLGTKVTITLPSQMVRSVANE